LTTVLAFYTVKNWHEACELSIELLKMGGIGHSFSMHSQDDRIIREFLRKPVFRILVNTPSAFGAIGYSTGLEPSMTLGCGTWGGSSISDNLSAHHLINIKRLAYGTRKVDLGEPERAGVSPTAVRTDEITEVVRQVLRQLKVS
jgi:acetaldehyde dehydrogenase (acetylating)